MHLELVSFPGWFCVNETQLLIIVLGRIPFFSSFFLAWNGSGAWGCSSLKPSLSHFYSNAECLTACGFTCFITAHSSHSGPSFPEPRLNVTDSGSVTELEQWCCFPKALCVARAECGGRWTSKRKSTYPLSPSNLTPDEIPLSSAGSEHRRAVPLRPRSSKRQCFSCVLFCFSFCHGPFASSCSDCLTSKPPPSLVSCSDVSNRLPCHQHVPRTGAEISSSFIWM